MGRWGPQTDPTVLCPVEGQAVLAGASLNHSVQAGRRPGLEEEATHWGLWPGVKCEFRVALTLTGGGWRGDPLVGEGARQAGPLECTACAPCPAELQMPPMCKMSVQESDHTQCRKSLHLKTGQSLPLLAKSLRWFRSEVCLWNSRRTPV